MASGPYDVFISYSTSADDRLAEALRGALQRFAKPWNRRRAMRVFLDRDSLEVSSDLADTLTGNLGDTRFLILLASRESAASRWCDHELRYWLEHHGSDTLLLVHTDADGGLRWDHAHQRFDTQASPSLPLVLADAFPNEPLWLDMTWVESDGGATELDLRSPKFRNAVATLAAPIHGVAKDDLEGEDVRQHRIFTQVRRAAIATLSVLLALSVGLALLAWQQTGIARDQRDEALRQAAIADARLARTLVTTDMRAALESAAVAYASASTPEIESVMFEMLALTAPLDWSRALEGQDITAAVAVGDRTAYGTAAGRFGLLLEDGSDGAVIAERNSPVVDVTPNSDGTMAAAAWGDGHVVLYDVESGTTVLDADVGQPISQVAPLDIGTPEVVVTTDEIGFVVNATGSREISALGPSQGPRTLAVVDGVATTTADGFAWSVDLSTNTDTGFARPGLPQRFIEAANGIATGVSLDDSERGVDVFEIPSLDGGGTFSGVGFERERLSFDELSLSANGGRLAILSGSLLEVWGGWHSFDEVAAARRVASVEGVAPSAARAELDQAGTVVVTSGGSTIQRWLVDSGAIVPQPASGADVTALLIRFRVVGNEVYWVADHGTGQTARLDLPTGTFEYLDGVDADDALALIGDDETSEARLDARAESADGGRRADIVDGRIVVTDVESGEVLARLETDAAGRLAFSDDGRYIVQATVGGGMRYWSLSFDDVCAAIERRVSPELAEQACGG